MPRFFNARSSPIVKVVVPLPEVAAPISNCGFIFSIYISNRVQI